MTTHDQDATPTFSESIKTKQPLDRVLVSLRLLAFFATASATVVMGLNKQTKTFVVATIGNNPVKTSITAQFDHTPAFIFFVVANGMASLHNWVIIVMDVIGHKVDFKGLRFAIIAILDMLTVGLAAGGDGAATFMADLGKNGNKHARWNKICDNFSTYCDHGSGALIASFLGLCLLMVISVMSIVKLQKPRLDSNIINVQAP